MQMGTSLCTIVVMRHGANVASWALGGEAAGLDTVDALARFALAARRLGYAIELRDVAVELEELLDLSGLRVEMRG
jgi:hypothetical protein